MGETFTYFSITGLINAVISLGFALYLTLTSWKVRLARYLIYLCLALGSWSTGYFLWQISDNYADALFWSRALMAGAIFTSISFLHLVIVFLGYDKIRVYKIMLVIFYVPCFVWEVLNFTPLFVATVAPRLFFQYWPLPGPFYLPYLILFGIHVIISCALLYKKFKRSVGVERKQAMMLMIGITTTFVFGSTNYFLWYDIPVAPWGNGLASAYAVLSIYAIMKYGLLNLRVLLVEIFIGVLLVVSVGNILLSKSSAEMIYNTITLVVLGFFGLMLVRSVRQEIKRREEITSLAHSLEQANIKLQELDRQKTDFLSIASHQLRTPLSILKGYVELLKDGAYGKVGKGVVEVLDNMDESNEHLVKLVDEFLDVTRIEQGRTKYDFTKFDLRELADGVAKELLPKAEGKEIHIKVGGEAKAEITADLEKVRHVVYNFIDNAIKYSDKGTVEVSVKNDGAGIELTVRDHGLGFDKVDEVNFFQKFYRGKNVNGTNVTGTGLGLYVCKIFIEAHGGRIWAKSPGPGQGSEFGFWIPVESNRDVGVKEESKSLV